MLRPASNRYNLFDPGFKIGKLKIATEGRCNASWIIKRRKFDFRKKSSTNSSPISWPVCR